MLFESSGDKYFEVYVHFKTKFILNYFILKLTIILWLEIGYKFKFANYQKISLII